MIIFSWFGVQSSGGDREQACRLISAQEEKGRAVLEARHLRAADVGVPGWVIRRAGSSAGTVCRGGTNRRNTPPPPPPSTASLLFVQMRVYSVGKSEPATAGSAGLAAATIRVYKALE